MVFFGLYKKNKIYYPHINNFDWIKTTNIRTVLKNLCVKWDSLQLHVPALARHSSVT